MSFLKSQSLKGAWGWVSVMGGYVEALEHSITEPLSVLQQNPSSFTPSPSPGGHSAAPLAVRTSLETPV